MSSQQPSSSTGKKPKGGTANSKKLRSRHPPGVRGALTDEPKKEPKKEPTEERKKELREKRAMLLDAIAKADEEALKKVREKQTVLQAQLEVQASKMGLTKSKATGDTDVCRTDDDGDTMDVEEQSEVGGTGDKLDEDFGASLAADINPPR